jgi:hypothetical protein
MYGGFWKNIVSVHQHMDLPLSMSDMFFQQLNTHRYSPVSAGKMSADCFFWRGRVRTDQRWDESVGVGGGQPGSRARARHSLATASPARVLSLPWGRGLKLRRTEVGRGRFLYIPVPNILCGSAIRSMCPTHPSPRRYPVIDKLPHVVCLGLS